MFSNDIVGASTRRRRHPRPAHACGCSSRACRPPRPRPRPASARRSAARTTGRPAQLARFVAEVAEQRRDRHGRPGDLPAGPVPARQRPHLVPAAGLPGRPVHRAARELRPRAPGRPRGERRPVRRPAASSATSTTSPGSPGSTRAALWSLAQAPGHAARTSTIDTTQLTNDTTLTLDARHRAGPGRLRGRVAGDHGAGLDARASRSATSTTATIDLSKDNVFFGVRAVDPTATAARRRSRCPADRA